MGQRVIRTITLIAALTALISAAACTNASEPEAPVSGEQTAVPFAASVYHTAPPSSQLPSPTPQEPYAVREITEPIYCDLYPANDYKPIQAMRVVKYGRHGYLDMRGREIGDINYDWAAVFQDGLGAVQKGDKWAVIGSDGRLLRADDPFVFDGFQPCIGGLMPVLKDGKWGLIDKTGHIVGSTGDGLDGIQYDAIDEDKGLSPDTLIVRVGDLSAYMGTNGEIIGDRWFNGMYHMNEDGVAAIMNDHGSPGIFKSDGSFTPVPDGWSLLWHTYFRDGYAFAMDDQYKYAVIDTNGVIQSEKRFDNAGGFLQGIAAVEMEGRYGILGVDGRIWGGENNIRFDEVKPLYHDLDNKPVQYVAVRLGDKWGIMDSEGQIIGGEEKIIYDEVCAALGDTLVAVKVKEKWKFIDTNGGRALESQYNDVQIYSSTFDYVPVSEDGDHWGYLKPDGTMLYGADDFRFIGAQPFSDGYAAACFGNGWGVIDQEGVIVVTGAYRSIVFGEITEREVTLFVQDADELWAVIRVYVDGVIPEDAEANTALPIPEMRPNSMPIEGIRYTQGFRSEGNMRYSTIRAFDEQDVCLWVYDIAVTTIKGWVYEDMPISDYFVNDDCLFLAVKDYLVALDAYSGEELWRMGGVSGGKYHAFGEDGTMYITDSSYGATLSAIDAGGRLLWRSETLSEYGAANDVHIVADGVEVTFEYYDGSPMTAHFSFDGKLDGDDREVSYKMYLTIADGMPEYSFTLNGRKKVSHPYEAHEFVVRDGERVIQSIDLRKAGYWDYPENYDMESFFVLEDMNFDGYLDLRIVNSYGAANIPYLYWLWDAQAGQFVRAPEMDAILNPWFDAEKKEAHAWEHESAAKRHEYTYRFIDGTLTMVEHITEGSLDPEHPKRIYRITYRLIDGEMKQVDKVRLRQQE